MKRLISLALACLALLAIGVTPASAFIDDPMINGRKFATTAICVGSTLNQSTYRVGYIAQTYNQLTEELALDYSTNCAADGYTPSRRMVIGTFNNPDYPYCTILQNQESSWYNGFDRWTNGPAGYINTGLASCADTQTRRDHYVSLLIGWHLGLMTLNSTGWNSHVMNGTTYSRNNVGLPHFSEGIKLDEVYRGVFCDIGTNC